jgi:hypothetical protein
VCVCVCVCVCKCERKDLGGGHVIRVWVAYVAERLRFDGQDFVAMAGALQCCRVVWHDMPPDKCHPTFSLRSIATRV